MYRQLWFTAAAALLAASLSQARTSKDTGSGDLKMIEYSAADAAKEAEDLDFASHDGRLSWEGQAAILARVKDDMNRIGHQVKELEARQNSLATWEREALVQSAPMLRDAADNTDNAIRILNENLAHAWSTPGYTQSLEKVMSDNKQAEKILHDFAKLDKTRHQEQQTRERLAAEGGL